MAFEVIELSKKFASRVVVDSVSFKVEPGEVVGLLGPNGAGKTTCFYMAVGLIRAGGGSILLDGEEITTAPLHLRAKKGLGYLPQGPSVYRKLSVRENLIGTMELVGTAKVKRLTLLEDLLDKFHLKHVEKLSGAALSGGERRRVEIARVLILSPSYLLLDEPFAGIDPKTVQEIQEIIKNLCEKEGLGVLLTDHNVRETLESCDRSYVLSSGRVVVEGGTEKVLSNPTVKNVYLGKNFKA